MKEGFDAQNLDVLIEQLKEKPEFNIRKANKQFLTNEESIAVSAYANKNVGKKVPK